MFLLFYMYWFGHCVLGCLLVVCGCLVFVALFLIYCVTCVLSCELWRVVLGGRVLVVDLGVWCLRAVDLRCCFLVWC